jgi:hypothetical protein
VRWPRTRRQCRDRWFHYLSPFVNKAVWTPAEDALIIRKQRELGSKWVKIAKFLPSRTDGMIKNRFLQLQRKARKGGSAMFGIAICVAAAGQRLRDALDGEEEDEDVPDQASAA